MMERRTLHPTPLTGICPLGLDLSAGYWGESKPIDEVRLYWETAYGKSYKIQVTYKFFMDIYHINLICFIGYWVVE